MQKAFMVKGDKKGHEQSVAVPQKAEKSNSEPGRAAGFPLFLSPFSQMSSDFEALQMKPDGIEAFMDG